MITCFVRFLICKLSFDAHFVAVFKSSEIFYVVSISLHPYGVFCIFCNYSTLESLPKSAKLVMWRCKCMCRSTGLESEYHRPKAIGLEFKWHMNFPTRKLESQFCYCKLHEDWNYNQETVWTLLFYNPLLFMNPRNCKLLAPYTTEKFHQVNLFKISHWSYWGPDASSSSIYCKFTGRRIGAQVWAPEATIFHSLVWIVTLPPKRKYPFHSQIFWACLRSTSQARFM